MKKLAITIIALGLLALISYGTYVAYNKPSFEDKIRDLIAEYVDNALKNQNLGADTVLPIAGTSYSLSGAGVSSSATSITLASLTLPQTGQELVDSDFSSTFYITLEPGNRSRQEIVSCTTVTQNSGTTATLSGCTRGLSPITPFTASSTLQFSHAGGSTVIFSDPPQLFNQFAAKDNDETITGTWDFTGNPTLDVDCTVGSANDEICAKAYIDGVSVAGASNANETTKGIVELATALEAASTTSTGGTSARLVIPSSMATDTPQSGCAVGYTSTGGAGCSVIAQLTGKIRQSFLNLTELWAFSTITSTIATFTNSTSTSFAVSGNLLHINGQNFRFNSLASTASSTVLASDGSDNFSLVRPTYTILYSNSGSFTGTTTQTIPANSLNAPNRVRIQSANNSGAGATCMVRIGNGSSTTTLSATANSPGVGDFYVVPLTASTQSYFGTNVTAANTVAFVDPTASTAFASTANIYVDFGGTSCTHYSAMITLISQ